MSVVDDERFGEFNRLTIWFRRTTLFYSLTSAVGFGLIAIVVVVIAVSRGGIGAVGIQWIVGAGAVAGTSATAFCYYLIYRPRLVLDGDFLQLIYFSGKVAGQVPFDNIVNVTLQK